MENSSLKHPHQKLGLVVVVVIGLVTLIFGVIGLRKSIFDPFVRRPTGVVFKTSDELEKERMEAMKHRDTDNDGLTDYDELYIYRTSPFLEDTDSDGISDGVEVKKGTDPNCPQGKTCRQPRTSTVAGGDQPVGIPDASVGSQPPADAAPPAGGGTSAAVPGGGDAAIIQLFTETFGPPETLTSEIIKAKLDAMTSSQLRAFFTKLGVPAAALQKADDATLRQTFLEMIKEMENQAAAAPAAGSGTSGTPPAVPR